MKPTLLTAFFLLLSSGSLIAQSSIVVQRDNGTPSGTYATSVGWEESVMLVPEGPCRVVEIQMYLDGPATRDDTIYIVGDPSEGAVPPTGWVKSYNTIALFWADHDGTPGWKTFDVRDKNIRSDGFDRIVLQHRIESGGLAWSIDNNDQGTPYGSFLMNPSAQSSLGFPGVYYLADADFMVRIVVEYDFPEDGGSASPPAPTMVDVTRQAGLTDDAGAVTNSARVGVVDWNSDGWDDIAVGSRFYQNNGDGTFSVANLGISASASVWADYDNDGDLDCFAAHGGTTNDILYRNDGGSFTDVTTASGISNPAPTVTPIWFDMDGDGRPELFISNGRTGDYPNEIFYRDRLFYNNGDGTFMDATDAIGMVQGEPDPNYDCWGAAPADYNGDGRTDLFVATYRLAPDLLYRNEEGNSFSEVGGPTGVRGERTTDNRYFGHGIGAEWADYNNDELIDLTVGNLGHPDWRGQVSNPSLVYRNDGPMNFRFTEVHRELGVKFFEMNAGVLWGDLDLDGYQDLFHCQYAYQKDGTGGEPRRRSRLYMNGGSGMNRRLRDMTWHTGLDIHGAWTAARLDYDRDGDLDLVVASPTDGLRLFRNDMERKGKAIAFRLIGDEAEGVARDGFGTRITLHSGSNRYFRELQGAGTGATATQHSNMLHFGVGDVELVDSIVVRWANGTRDVFTNLATGNEYRLELGGEGPEVIRQFVSSVEERSGDDASTGGGILLSDARYEEGMIRLGLRIEGGFDVTIDVVNAAGEIVATTSVRDVSNGVQSIPIDRALPSGVYLVRVTAGENVVSAKVSVVR